MEKKDDREREKEREGGGGEIYKCEKKVKHIIIYITVQRADSWRS